MSQRTLVSGTLAATGQSDWIFADKFSLSLAGVWAGTAKLQMRDTGAQTIVDITDGSFTANTVKACENGSKREVRIDFARTSGTLEYTLKGGD